MNSGIITIAAVIIFIAGAGFGVLLNNSSWKNDCREIGHHIAGYDSAGKAIVFQCRPVEAK